jgi:DNA-binding CsgD family transcriptional regulator
MFKHFFYNSLIAIISLNSFIGYPNKTTTFKEVGFIKNISFLKDEKFDFPNIKKQKFTTTNTSKISVINGMYWFKIELKKSASKKNIIIQIDESSIDFIELYNNSKKISDLTNNLGLTNIVLNVKKTEATTYYIKVNFPIQVHFPLSVLTKEQQHKNSLTYLFNNGWYYGLVFMLMIINLFFYFSLKDSLFLLYSLFLLAINFAIAHYDGFVNLIISHSIRHFSNSLSHFIVAATGVLFATKFLNLNRYIPESKKTSTILLCISFIFYNIHLFTNAQIYYALANTIAFSTLFYYWVLGFKTFDKNDFAKFFVLGYSLILFSGIFYVLPIGLGISSISISLKTVKFAAVFEMLVLTYAITYRVQKMKEENENTRLEIQNYIKQLCSLEEKIESGFKVEKNISIDTKIEQLKSDHKLTNREADVLLCLSKGYTNKRISEELFVSLNTVKYHTRNIYQKLNIKTKTEAVSLLIT